MSLVITPNQAPLVSGTNIQSINGSNILTSGNLFTDTSLLAYAALGSATKGQTPGFSIGQVTTGVVLADGQARFVWVYVPQAVTITGVRWYQAVQGNFTADNNNRIGLCSYSGGTLTLIASCADDANLWKGASGTIVNKDFSSTVAVVPGIYFVVMLYNNSAQVAAPSIGTSATLGNASECAFDFTNSAKAWCSVNGQTNIAGPYTMSGLAGNTATHVMFLY